MNANGTKKRGLIYTFYSFKGGVGRTMALANVAALLAKWGHSVLAVDWDLEAPGLERFFFPPDEAARLRASKPGIVDLLRAKATTEPIDWHEGVLRKDGLAVLTAGRDDGDYVRDLQSLDFEELFTKHDLGAYIESLRDQWATEYDFVLIDSRTGLTDIGGICTVHFADVLVLFFTTTESSSKGVLDVVERARRAQQHLPRDRSRLLAVPVPSRDESRTEYERATRWKSAFAEMFNDLYRDWLPSGIAPQEAIDVLRIPYVPYWSFGERLAAIEEGTSDPSSLGYALEVLARLISARLDWYEAIEGHTPPPPPRLVRRSVDPEWLTRHRAAAMEGLARTGKAGFMEVCHFCIDKPAAHDQEQLLRVATQAMVHTAGWPIGVVLHNSADRPQPTSEGIVAKISGLEGEFDYWALTKAGDFYTLTSLFEDSRSRNEIFFNTRIVRTTEALMHCANIYKLLGYSPGASVQFAMTHGGLRGRWLGATRKELLAVERTTNEDQVAATVEFRLDSVDSEMITLVKKLCEPLFMVFDYQRIPDHVYERVVNNFVTGKVT